MAHLISEYLYTGEYPKHRRVDVFYTVPESPLDQSQYANPHQSQDTNLLQSQDTNQLLEVLRLAHFWEIKALLDEVQVALINHISLENYGEIREHVEQYEASILMGACDEFKTKNRDTIRRFDNRAY